MSHRLSQNARNTSELLQELERDKELEVLREYLTRFDLFPRKRDPASAPIRFEELKELVKHWKLHRQRNFWKNHTTKEDLVRTLYRHINTKIIPQETRDESSSSGGGNANGSMSGTLQPSPPPGNPGGPMGPTAPARKLSIGSIINESPRSKSILVTSRSPAGMIRGPRRENVLSGYSGDLFSQRGDYEDGMIYLSRFRKPGSIDMSNPFDVPTDNSNQESKKELDEDDESVKSQEHLALPDGLTREIHLKQECAFSIYYFTTVTGNERQMVSEGGMLAISRLSTFDDLDVKKFCAAAILNLTCETSLCVRMLDEGALLALLELAKAQHEEIRRNTSMALCRISYERAGQLRLVQEGCVSAIISMLNSPDHDTKEACIKALINIASASGATVAESVVQTILKISSKKEPASVSFSAEAICNLSLLSGPRAKVVEDGILDNICELCQSVNDSDVKLNVATALCNFSGLQSNLEMLSQVRVLECLEDLLKYDSDLVRERCAVTIANISSFAPSLKNLGLSEAVVQLIDLGQRANQAVQENTALSLSNMSATPDSRPLLARFGVVSLLLYFLEQEASVQTKQYAIITLCSLLANPSTCTELLQSNIPSVLARLSGSGHEKIKELCSSALFNISCERSLHGFLLKDENIKAIVRLCKKMIMKDGVEVEDEAAMNPADKTPIMLQRSQECALSCIFNLSFVDDSRKILIRVDVVKTLFTIFQRPIKNEEMLKLCAGVVANLSFDVESRARMVEDNCIRLIRKLMSSGNKDTLLCCSTACCNLAAEGLEKTPVLSMLIDLSSSPHANITLTCAIAFSKLASNSTFRPTLTKCAELYPALTLMMRCGIEDIQIYSAVTLCNLAIERSRSRHIWKEGTVPDFIVNSLLRINSDSTKEICARALYNLLTHDEYRMAHIKEGVLYALVKLARLESVEIRSLCVTALYNLSCDPAMIDVLMEINVAQVITKLCEIEFSNQDIHRRLAACLTNIAMKPGTELKLVEGGALVAMLVLAEHNDPPTMRYCASVLCYLSSLRSNCEAMATNNLVETLVKIISSDDAQQNIFGLNALCNISTSPALHDRLEEAGTIAQIIRLLGMTEHDEVLLACAQTLANLTFHPKNRKIMLEKNLIQVFESVFVDRSSTITVSQEVVDVCVDIIAVLTEDPQEWGELISSGAVKVLKAVAQHCSPSSVLSCVYALSQLVRCEKASVQVLADGAIDVLAAAVPMITGDGKDGKPASPKTHLGERCSAILRTLSTASECAPAQTQDERLIPLIQSIAAGGGKELFKNLILALYNITGCKHAALDKLIAGGVVKLLIHLANVGGAEMAPACAVALAHIKHSRQHKEVAILGEGDDTTAAGAGADEMEDGVVATLLAMIELDHISIQRVDRMAATVPANLPPLRPAEWVFIPGSTSLRIGSQLPVSWVFHSSSIDDTRFVPAEPRSFLTSLAPVVPPSGVSVQDKVYGSFRVMKVRDEKVRVKILDARLQQVAALTDGSIDGSTSSLVDAISLAMADELEMPNSSAASQAGSEGNPDWSAGMDDGSEADEMRMASPTKKRSGMRLHRAGSNRGSGSGSSANDLGIRRPSKTTSSPHKSTRQNLGGGHHELRSTPSSGAVVKKDASQRKYTSLVLGGGDSDRIILPRLVLSAEHDLGAQCLRAHVQRRVVGDAQLAQVRQRLELALGQRLQLVVREVEHLQRAQPRDERRQLAQRVARRVQVREAAQREGGVGQRRQPVAREVEPLQLRRARQHERQAAGAGLAHALAHERAARQVRRARQQQRAHAGPAQRRLRATTMATRKWRLWTTPPPTGGQPINWRPAGAMAMAMLRAARRRPLVGPIAGARRRSAAAGDAPHVALPADVRARVRGAPMAATYDPEQVERGWQAFWQRVVTRHGPAFDSAQQRRDRTLSMILPPPNVTGALHIGHALTITIQDAIARWHRMRGFDVRWLPGLDHAGIATQSVVERKLQKERGLTRHDLGREAFVDQVWKWNEQYGGRIMEQIDHLGAIVKKDQTYFTLDDIRSTAVIDAFVKLHERGLIYRRRRMVNWCPTLQTAISDIEVDAEQLEGSTMKSLPGYDKPIEFGVMHRILYKVADSDEYLEVDTTRPETIFGDVAVAVHPDDERYTRFHGQEVIHPFSGERIPIVTDPILVNMELGTGVVKVTPAHDPKDFECGQRHNLPEKEVIDKYGKMCGDIDEQFHQLDRFHARQRVVEDLQAKGLYVDKLDHSTTLSICSRSGNVIEPLLMPQWFVDCGSMAKRAVDNVRNGVMAIEPKTHQHTWFYFLENIQDWCVSRQLWWGHRIPAYRVSSDCLVAAQKTVDNDQWFVGRSITEARQKAELELGVTLSDEDLEQDVDVLDTWFSSGLLPLSALGWPNEHANPEAFDAAYPLNLMETGSDILFFWVARMAMLCEEFSGRVPFEKVLLHPMVRDKAGRKMSKSLGNVIDPLHVIHGITLDQLLSDLMSGNVGERELKKAEKELKKEFPNGIPTCGTDALRFTLASYLQQGRQINMNVQRVISYRHFCNKIWNAVRYALPLLESKGNGQVPRLAKAPGNDLTSLRNDMSLADRWILSRLANVVAEVNKGIETNHLASSVASFQRFFIQELCDVYIEFSKPVLYGNRLDKHSTLAESEEARELHKRSAQATLHRCLDYSMRLLHPFSPFVTEELWQRICLADPLNECEVPETSILCASYPEEVEMETWQDLDVERRMALVLDVIHGIRSLRHTVKTLAPTASTDVETHRVQVLCSDEHVHSELLRATYDVETQCRIAIDVVNAAGFQSPAGVHALTHSVSDACKVMLAVPGDAETTHRVELEITRLEKRLAKSQKATDVLEQRQSDAQYATRVPEAVRAQDSQRFLQLQTELHATEKSLDALRELQQQY